MRNATDQQPGHPTPPTLVGAPSVEPPRLDEPVEPREPLPPKADQRAPEPVSPTGTPTGAPVDSRSQAGAYLTTSQGVRLPDTDHSLKAGPRGSVLLRDHHLREKITHFDHERIPERVVHARGAAAHGIFTSYGTGAKVTKAGFLAEGAETPVFARFSTVLGSRGSADTARDTRGFAVKFYTDEGTFDLIGNNIPVFFIQDGIKFPDIIHAAKPHPDREIPQAQSAHDTFWDFVSLHTEAQHHTMWNMSDRALPRSFAMMEGFGVHTFRLVAADGTTSLVKWHWKPKAGVHSLLWEEAQLLMGMDPDFHRRDLADSIEAGVYPQYELGIQIMPDTDDQMFEGIDLLDPTKMIPEELAPVHSVGLLTLNANPTNYFAETEQVAFHVGNLVPGIDVTDDPLMAARLFSYIDTQITRLGGPNFGQLPINRPHAPVNDMLRDGMHQTAVHGGIAPYRPNSMDGGCPFRAGADVGGYIEVPQVLPEARKVRQAPASFDDHTSQVRQFWLSMTPVEQEHIVTAYTFELGKCYEQTIRERQLMVLATIDPVLCASVAAGLGMPAPEAAGPMPDVEPSAALSQMGEQWPVQGRKIGILVDEASDLAAISQLTDAIEAEGMVGLIIGARGGKLGEGTPNELTVHRTLLTTRSVEFDAVIAAAPPRSDVRITLLLSESFRHCKAIGALSGSEADLATAGIPDDAPGVVVSAEPAEMVSVMTELLTQHRVWDRFPPAVA